MSVLAVGVFDGLHRGHRALIDRARALAGDGRCVAVSFDPHPDIVLAKEFRAIAPLTPLPEKQERLAAMGVELHVLPFTRELAALSPEEFVERHLVGPFAPRVLVVGADFALGRGRAGNVERLRAIGAGHGFTVEAVDLLGEDGEIVSSSRIRAALAEGRVGDAARWLGRRYSLVGLVVHGDKIGRTLGWPTANLRLHDEKAVPALGIYAVWARIAGEQVWRAGAMSVGIRPTFDGKLRTLEVHLLDWDGDLYGRDVEVQFVEWLRPELKFDGRDALVAAIAADVEKTRVRLADPANAPEER
ncbi:MAG: bifunctional riboflavin kinase/FAD synthetase [Candidatus Eisenbacteria bacterium]